MAHIEFLDETLRDGQQSLWGMRMQAGMALPIAPLLDKTGFCTIDLTGSSMFEVMIRHCREDPWEGLDLLLDAMPRYLGQLDRVLRSSSGVRRAGTAALRGGLGEDEGATQGARGSACHKRYEP